MSRVHNELSQVTVTATVRDTDGDLYTPQSARYRVDDCKTGTLTIPKDSKLNSEWDFDRWYRSE